MRLRDILVEDQRVADDAPEGFYDPSEDKVESKSMGDRRPKLTLRMVNRLKKIRSTRNLEMAKKQELLGIMYGNHPDEEA